MAYSTKQKLFAEFMLKRIGFNQPELIEQYLTQLENVFGRWSEWTNNSGYTSLTYSVSDCIQMLVDEIEIKKNKQEIQSKIGWLPQTGTNLTSWISMAAGALLLIVGGVIFLKRKNA